MKKTLLMIFALLAVSAVNAQNEQPTIRWGNYTPNGFWDNWELSAGVGANCFVKLGDNERTPFKDNVDLSLNFSVNKWFSPIVGGRVQLLGYSASTKNKQGDVASWRFMYLHYDQLFNLTNWFCGYKSDRFYNAVFFVGMGLMHNFKNTEDEFAASFGLQNRFRICDAWNIDLELQSVIQKPSFDGVPAANSKLITRLATDIAVTVGVTYQFKTRDWQGLPQCKPDEGLVKKVKDLEKDNDNNKRALQEVQDINEQLQAELDKAKAALKEQMNKKPEQNLAQGDFINDLPSFTVFFNIGESVLNDRAQQIVKTIVEILKKTDVKMKFLLTGYSDKETGSHSLNMRLSKKRAESVRDAFVDNGIAAEKINIDYKGDTEQPLGKGSINRCVIIIEQDTK